MSVYEEPGKIHKKSEFRIQQNNCYATASIHDNVVSTGQAKNKRKMDLLPSKFILSSAVFVSVLVIMTLFNILYFELHISKANIEKCSQLDSKLNALNTSIKQLTKKLFNNLTNLREEFGLNYNDQLEIVIEATQDIFNGLSSLSPFFPVPSCAALPRSYPSGYYWIQSTNSSNVRVYCDMTRTCGNITGGWMRVAELDMTRSDSQCPPGLCLNSSSPRTCRICSAYGNCSLDVYSVQSEYSKVCGMIIGYQVGSVDGFSEEFTSGFDGVSLSYQNMNNTIWTFVAAISETYTGSLNSVCPCINPSDPNITEAPSNLTNYFCDTGAYEPAVHSQYYSGNPLWDGVGCTGHNLCCSFNNPPWFYRELPQPTTEDIEMRVCRNEESINEDVAIEVVNIYVQ